MFEVKYWETEDDRDMGESCIHRDEIKTLDDAREIAENLWLNYHFACVEVQVSETAETKSHFSYDGGVGL